MSGKTGIEWTDRTWNPVVGCTKVSQGCKHCYAKMLHDMRHQAHLEGKKVAPQYHVPFEVVQLKPERLRWPISLREPSRIFVNSVSDLFHEDVPFDYVDDVFAAMALAPRHTFQVLTKRPARMRDYLLGITLQEGAGEAFYSAQDDICRETGLTYSLLDQGWPLPNVWLGVSVENQAAADERIPLLLQTPAAVRFLSCEPLLGPLELSIYLEEEGYIDDQYVRPIDWVIAGGESGRREQKTRAMAIDWARSLRDQCVSNAVPFLFKQWGDWFPLSTADEASWFPKAEVSDDQRAVKIGKSRSGRMLDGRTWDEFPQAVTA